MTDTGYCGIDFGTSNSTVGICHNNKISLAPVELHHTTIPSAIFFDYEEHTTLYGRSAVSAYIERVEGRLMRSLKSVLGTSLMEEKTIVSRKPTAFTDIIGMFIRHLKTSAESALGQEVSNVVLGRPVLFSDDSSADREAEKALELAARAQGFENIVFQYEPIAAALDFEQTVTEEKLTFIIDIGGGTSDFSIVRVSPENHLKKDRRDDVLANTGVRVGGTDFDRVLDLERVMPHLGYRSEIWNFTRTEKIQTPNDYFVSLATWHMINTVYKKERIEDVRQMIRFSLQSALLERLHLVIREKLGHRILNNVENAKIVLSDSQEADIDLSFLEKSLHSTVTQREFEETIHDLSDKISATVSGTFEQAGIKASDIQAVFLTGGSTSIPCLQNTILSMFPTAEKKTGDLFGSVGTGLAIEAGKLFGTVA